MADADRFVPIARLWRWRSNPDSNQYTYKYSNGHTNEHAHQHPDPHQYTYKYPDGRADEHAHQHSYKYPNGRTD